MPSFQAMTKYTSCEALCTCLQSNTSLLCLKTFTKAATAFQEEASTYGTRRESASPGPTPPTPTVPPHLPPRRIQSICSQRCPCRCLAWCTHTRVFLLQGLSSSHVSIREFLAPPVARQDAPAGARLEPQPFCPLFVKAAVFPVCCRHQDQADWAKCF